MFIHNVLIVSPGLDIPCKAKGFWLGQGFWETIILHAARTISGFTPTNYNLLV